MNGGSRLEPADAVQEQVYDMMCRKRLQSYHCQPVLSHHGGHWSLRSYGMPRKRQVCLNHGLGWCIGHGDSCLRLNLQLPGYGKPCNRLQ